MAGEATEVVADDAGFDDGFASVGEQTATPASQQDQAPEQTAEAETTAAPEPEFVKVTKSEWDDVKRRVQEVDTFRQEARRDIDRAFGQYGSLKQATEALAKRGPIQIEAEDFQELKETYGEEIANDLVAGLRRSIARVPQPVAEPLTQAPAQPARDDGAIQLQAQLVNSRLDEVVDGDWQAEVRTPEFQGWKEKQPPEVKALADSSDVRDASRLLRLWVKSKTAAPTAAAAPKAQDKAAPARQRVMAAAVNPRGGGARASASNEPDPFDEGFNS